MKYLLITQCNDPLMWYADMIGFTVPLIREDAEYYWSLEQGRLKNIVKKSDAVILDTK